MLNTKKYLYIMPDSAYLAELLPTKKAHSFTVQVFRQINGEFIDENEFIAEHIEKLIKKIDPDEYHLILPDFLFTNTIVDVNETSEAEVKKYLKETLLPSLDLSKETHELDTFILTQHQGKSKVQLSALEKSLLVSLQKACEEQKVKITNISPLSWTIKSVISLEPSLSTIQMGSMLYLSQHYIGIDQTISFKIEDAANVIETVKTLKGAEPNIQTMYLLTNVLVENEIKEKLSGTLPIQQLANYVDEQEGMPAHIKQIIEASAKTLDITDYPVPRFDLGKYVPGEGAVKEETEDEEESKDEEFTPVEVEEKEEAKPEIKKLDLDEDAQESAEIDDDEEEEEEEKKLPSAPVSSSLPVPSMPEAKSVALAAEVIEPPKKMEKEETDKTAEPSQQTPTVTSSVSGPIVSAPAVSAPITSLIQPPTSSVNNGVISPGGTPTPPPQTNMIPLGYMTNTSTSSPMSGPEISTTPKTVIKNKSDAGSLLKIVGITLGALLITVGLGVGIGFGLLSYTQKREVTATQSPTPSNAPEVSPSLAPSPSPSPSPTTVAKDKVKILIVNATKTAGKAGKLKSTLTAAGYKSIETGNAQGTYSTPGTYVLMANEDQSFISTLSKDAGVTLTYNADKDTEDPKGAYDVVIVLNE
jgi:hypothetical protein